MTVGIVDPGWNGPLSTAVINFSGTDFYIRKGEPFFRTAFFEHQSVDGIDGYRVQKVDRNDYIAEVQSEARLFDETFLTFSTLVPEVAKEILRMPRLGAYAAWFAIAVSLLGLIAAFAAPAISTSFSLAGEVARKNARISELETKLGELDGRVKSLNVELTTLADEKVEVPPAELSQEPVQLQLPEK